jgi:hypothetical protein
VQVASLEKANDDLVEDTERRMRSLRQVLLRWARNVSTFN